MERKYEVEYTQMNDTLGKMKIKQMLTQKQLASVLLTSGVELVSVNKSETTSFKRKSKKR